MSVGVQEEAADPRQSPGPVHEEQEGVQHTAAAGTQVDLRLERPCGS